MTLVSPNGPDLFRRSELSTLEWILGDLSNSDLTSFHLSHSLIYTNTEGKSKMGYQYHVSKSIHCII